MCVTSEEVRLWTGRRQKLADCGRPHASQCGSVRTGRPLAGKREVLGGQGLSLLIDLRVSRGIRRGVRLRGEAARRVEAVSDVVRRGKGGGRLGLAQVRWRRGVG